MSKFISDSLVVFEIEIRRVRNAPLAYLLSGWIAPLGLLWFSFAVVGDARDGAADLRLISGGIIFGFGLLNLNTTSQFLMYDRFMNSLKLLIVSPVRPLSYALGLMAFSLVMSTPTAATVLIIGQFFTDIRVSALLIPILILIACSMTSLGLLIGSWAPSWETGGMLSQLAGLVLALMSPVFYPIDRLPLAIRWVAYVSPYTYAGVAMRRSMSGDADVLAPAVILAILAAAAFVFGVRGFRWRTA